MVVTKKEIKDIFKKNYYKLVIIYKLEKTIVKFNE